MFIKKFFLKLIDKGIQLKLKVFKLRLFKDILKFKDLKIYLNFLPDPLYPY